MHGAKPRHLLGLIGSPRRGGSTELLVQAVLAAAEDAQAHTHAVRLGDLTIGECDGCHACWKGKVCPRHDDMNSLYGDIAAADAIVFGTPVYWYGPTALMKALVDRLVYFNCPQNRPLVRGKQAALVVPFEEDDPNAADLLLAMFCKSFEYLEMEFAGAVLVPGVTRKGEAASRPDVLAEAAALGRLLAR